MAALNVFVLNIGVWASDRYISNKDYSHISWKSWKRNLSHGFIWDSDSLGIGFFGHPYHGSQYFAAARSLGLNFWESTPYAFGGYLMWGEFLENDPPSKNDLIMTGLGGMVLGESLFRISSSVLDDSATGAERIWREIVAGIIDPVRGLSRLIYGGACEQSPENRQVQMPVHGSISLGATLVSPTSKLSGLKLGTGADLDLVYGLQSSEISSRRPFDLMFFNGEIRYGQQKGNLGLSSYGLLFGKEFGGGEGPRHVLGIFQHYDYQKNEAVRMGGTSLTAGLVSVFPLGGQAELKTSLQLGGMLLGAFQNDNIMFGNQHFNYGWGSAAKAEAWLNVPRFGTMSVRFGNFRLSTIERAALSEATESRDTLTYINAGYTVPLGPSLGLHLHYGYVYHPQRFVGLHANVSKTSQIGAALEARF
jgi:hypothetical protein